MMGLFDTFQELEPQFSNVFQNRMIHSNTLNSSVVSNGNFELQGKQILAYTQLIQLPLFNS